MKYLCFFLRNYECFNEDAGCNLLSWSRLCFLNAGTSENVSLLLQWIVEFLTLRCWELVWLSMEAACHRIVDALKNHWKRNVLKLILFTNEKIKTNTLTIGCFKPVWFVFIISPLPHENPTASVITASRHSMILLSSLCKNVSTFITANGSSRPPTNSWPIISGGFLLLLHWYFLHKKRNTVCR